MRHAKLHEAAPPYLAVYQERGIMMTTYYQSLPYQSLSREEEIRKKEKKEFTENGERRG